MWIKKLAGHARVEKKVLNFKTLAFVEQAEHARKGQKIALNNMKNITGHKRAKYILFRRQP